MKASQYWFQKHALITGGSKGLGRCLAENLACAGAEVTLVARDPNALNETCEFLRDRANAQGQSPRVRAVACDVTSNSDVSRLFDQELAGRDLDLLINCAGRSSRQRIEETSVEDFRELLEINFLAAVRLTQAALPGLLRNKGHIVNIGSLASKTAPAYLGAYPASKFPLVAYSQQLRLELADQGLRVLMVCPGPIHRDDAGSRYDEHAGDLPASARKPGGGAKVRQLDPHWLAARILAASERGTSELVLPQKAKILFALSQLWPDWGDRMLKRKTQ